MIFMAIAQDLMDFFPGTELKRGRRILLNRHTGLVIHSRQLGMITHDSPTLPLLFSLFVAPLLMPLFIHTSSLFPVLAVYEVIHVFFIPLDMPGPFIIPDASNVLNLRQVLIIA